MSSKKILTIKSSTEIPDAIWISKLPIVRMNSLWYRVLNINVLDFLVTFEELTDQEFVDIVAKEI